MLLRQISSSTTLSAAFLAEVIRNAVILEYLQFYSMVGNADAPRKASGAEGGAYRVLDANYPDNIITPEFASPQLVILGDQVQTDVAHERRGADIPSVRAADLRAFAEYFGRFVQDEFVNGGGQPTAVNGVEGMLPMSNPQAIYAGADNATPLAVSGGNSDTVVEARQKLKRKLNKLIGMIDGGPDILLLSNDLIQFITAVFEASVDRVESEFGTLITRYNRIPLVPAGYAPGGGAVIAQDEQPGSIVTNTQSVYALRFGERTNLTAATNVGVQVTDKGVVGVHYTYHVDLDAQTTLLNDRAVGRLAGIELG